MDFKIYFYPPLALQMEITVLSLGIKLKKGQ